MACGQSPSCCWCDFRLTTLGILWQVSKLFRAITCRASVWRHLYASSYLLRPPGPFPFQSAAYLEEALVKAEKVARSWMTKPMRGTSSVELRVEQQPAGPIKLLAGKWVIGCESGTRIILYDAATLSEQRRRVIWEHEEPVETWDVGFVTSEEGQCLLYVLLSHEDLDIPWWYACICYCGLCAHVVYLPPFLLIGGF